MGRSTPNSGTMSGVHLRFTSYLHMFYVLIRYAQIQNFRPLSPLVAELCHLQVLGRKTNMDTDQISYFCDNF